MSLERSCCSRLSKLIGFALHFDIPQIFFVIFLTFNSIHQTLLNWFDLSTIFLSGILYKADQDPDQDLQKKPTQTFRKSGPYTKINCMS